MKAGILWVVVPALLLSCGSSDDGTPASDAEPVADGADAIDVPGEPVDAADLAAPDEATFADGDVAAEPSCCDGATLDTGPGAEFLWEGYDPPPQLPAGGWLDSHPLLGDFSSFVYHHAGADPVPDASHLGDFAVGNGRTFWEIGLALPVTTLHNGCGPTYARRDHFYSDVVLRLGDANGAPVDLADEWIASVRMAPVVVTKTAAAGDPRVMTTFDFTPRAADGEAIRAVHAALWRHVQVANPGTAATPASTLVVTTALSQTTDAGAMVEKSKDGIRILYFAQPGATIRDDKTLVLPLPALDAGGTWEGDLVLATAAPDAIPGDVRAAIATEDGGKLLDATAKVYQDWETSTTQFFTPDPVVNDFFPNLRRMLWTQVSAQGAATPLSRYTMAWTRDLSGFVRGFLALGAPDLAARVIDYYSAVAAQHGSLIDAYEADVNVDLVNPPAVDWESLPTLALKAQAEGPSHLPLVYGWLAAATGDTARAVKRIGYLRHALYAQVMTDDFLQPFSGDETYRAAMNVVFGLALEYPHNTDSWSLSSGLLLAAAAHWLASIETAGGDATAAARATKLETDVAAATKTHYALADGCLGSFIDKATGKLYPPFEDALLNGTWAGPPWDGSADADAIVDCLVRRVHDGPGGFQSPLDPSYDGLLGLPIHKGIYTGMLPGYTLRAMTSTGHPEAEAAFNRLRWSMSQSGNFAEYHAADDHSALEFIYDAEGGISDYTARYRPWEGGINADAAAYYLTGFDPDAPANRAHLRPHLPNGWDHLTVQPLRVGASALRLEVTPVAGAMNVVASLLSGPAVTLSLTHDAKGTTAPAVSEGGTAVDSKDLVVTQHFGHAVVTLPDCLLSAVGAACTWRLAP